MLSMIKLDWLGMKCYWVRIVIVPLVVCVYGFLHEALVIPLIAFLMLSFSVNPFAVEEKGKLDNLYLTLPVTRKSIVNARFALSFIMQFVGIIFGTFITIILSAILNGRTIFYEHAFKADFPTLLLIICGSLLIYAIMNLSTFPILFKIGYAKGKAIGFYIPIATASILIFILYMLWNFNDGFRLWLLSALEWSFAHTVWTAVIIGLAVIMVIAISYVLSQKLYAKREF